MAEYLARLKSVRSRIPSTCTASVNSYPNQALPDKHLDKLTGTPIIAPLDTVDQVFSWVSGTDEFNVGTVPLSCQLSTRAAGGRGGMDDPSAQKMIVCHDMMGGYGKDKFTQGTRDMEDYYFYHWHNIGAFIYFSHHFITIPPPAWTNVAHRHGVLSMGTLITESEEGAKLCFSLLQSENKVGEFAQRLVEIALYYGFDGWLINIENPIHPRLQDQLYMLLSMVTSGMHASIPGSKVIWYDSVTTEGKLKWQNMLNELNRPYFDLCDGIFLNYNWTDKGLATSRAMARGRKGEVYVGIDVFGRGCPGGGGYNSCEALARIHDSGLSSALFAPGWVFETQDKQHFFTNQNRFWSLLQPWLSIAPVTSLPLVSSFGRGCGKILAVDGKVVFSGEWANHSSQDPQPSFTTESLIQNDTESAVDLEYSGLDLTAAYNNGASILVKGRVRNSARPMTKPSILRLFKTMLSLSRPLIVSYTYKMDPATPTSGYRYFLQLHTTGSPTRIFLDPSSSPGDTDGEELLEGYGLPRSCDVPMLPGCVLAPLPERHSATLHQIYTGGEEQGDTWKTRYFVVDCDKLRDKHITDITIGFYAATSTASKSTNDRNFSLNIGQLQVIDSLSLSPKSEVSFITNIWCHMYHFSQDNKIVSFTLSWQPISSEADPIDHCNVYLSSIITDIVSTPWRSEYVFQGRSYSKSCYRVTDLHLLSPPAESGGGRVSFELSVQAVLASRSKLPISDCPSIVVNFEQ